MIKIITDSAADLTKEMIEKYNAEVVPLHVSFGSEEYLDGVTLSGHAFFEKLIESDVLPKTSQIAPFEFEEVFKKYPHDDILCITLSKKLSGTYQSAMIAAEEFPNVKVVDSENVTVGESILIKYAHSLIEEGKSIDEIVDCLNKKKKKIRLIALLDTLEYLKKGGRIGIMSALLGSMLHIKPVVEVQEGKVAVIGKARGSKQGNNMLRVKVKESKGIDFSMPYALGYSGLSDVMLDKYIQDSSDLYPEGIKFERVLIGSTIGTHIGPGAIAVTYFEKE